MKRGGFYWLLVFIIIGVDQTSKFIIVRMLSLYSSRTIIPGFFNLSLIHNRGAIFGFFSQTNNRGISIILSAASLLALGIVVYFFLKTPLSEKWMKISLSLILGGALGNQMDRIFRGYVVDFMEFSIRRYHWPTFNVADSCITIGALMLIIIIFFRRPSCSPSSSN
ncbi:MAG: signal peptidase II [Candidatus Aminicenantales bacterium]